MPCRNGTCRISIRGSRARPFKADLARAEAECKAFAEAYRGKLDAMAARRGCAASTRRSAAALRGGGGSARPADVLCGPRLFRRHDGSGARQVLRRHAGAADGCVERALVLRARTEPDRRCGHGRGDGGRAARPLPALDRGSAQGQALPARRPDRAALPREVGDRPLRLEPAVRRDDRVAALQRARRGTADRADAQQAAGSGREHPQGRLRRARQDLQGESAHLHARSPTRSPRTRRSRTAGAASRTWPIRATSQTGSSARSSRRSSPPCARPIRACRTAIMP